MVFFVFYTVVLSRKVGFVTFNEGINCCINGSLIIAGDNGWKALGADHMVGRRHAALGQVAQIVAGEKLQDLIIGAQVQKRSHLIVVARVRFHGAGKTGAYLR